MTTLRTMTTSIMTSSITIRNSKVNIMTFSIAIRKFEISIYDNQHNKKKTRYSESQYENATLCTSNTDHFNN
jgi:hypothetical protein